jgi:hypothetical protein
MNALDATSKHVQAVANEMFEMSKQSMNQATQTLDKLRSTRVLDEVMSIQSDYVKQAFAYYTQLRAGSTNSSWASQAKSPSHIKTPGSQR